MSFIDTIEIKNFKSIRHQKIEGCKRINLFIGYPNVGKSNILEALSLISFAKENQEIPLKLLARYRELVDLFFFGDSKHNIEVWVDDFVLALKFLGKKYFQIGFLNKKNYSEDFNENSNDILKYMLFERDGILKEISSKAEFLSPFDVRKYQFMESGRVVSGQADEIIGDDSRLSFPYGDNLGEVIRSFPELREECGRILSEYNLKLIFNENHEVFVQKQLDNFSAFQFSFSQVADTLRRLIFFKAAILSNKDSVLLFEEPEAHMFPPYVSNFANDVMSDRNRNQFFIATHSPYVLNDFIEDLSENELAIYAIGYNNESGETKIRRFSAEEVKEVYSYGVDLFFNLEDYLKDVVS